MNRITAREIAVQAVYALEFSQPAAELSEERTDPSFYETLSGEDALFRSPPDEEQSEFIRSLIGGVETRLQELDEYIARFAKGWQFKRLPRVAVAVMRVCIYELLYRPDIPPRAAINAAVEISKHYEPAEITAYINGVLGSFIRELRPETASELPEIPDLSPEADDTFPEGADAPAEAPQVPDAPADVSAEESL